MGRIEETVTVAEILTEKVNNAKKGIALFWFKAHDFFYIPGTHPIRRPFYSIYA